MAFMAAFFFITFMAFMGGLSEAYYVLAALFLINNVFLAVAYFMMPKDEDGAIDDIVMPDERTALIPATRQSPVATPKKVSSPHDSPMMPTVSTEVGLPDTAPPPAATVGSGGKRLAGVSAEPCAHRFYRVHCASGYGQVEHGRDSPVVRWNA